MEDECKITNECVNCPIVKKKLEAIKVELIQKKTWLNTSEVAIYTGLSHTEIRRLRLDGTPKGTMPYYRIKNSVRFKRTEVEDFLSLHEVKALW